MKEVLTTIYRILMFAAGAAESLRGETIHAILLFSFVFINIEGEDKK